MGSLDGRLRRLEERPGEVTEDEKERGRREFFKRLTREELDWLDESARQASSLVPCPHVELIECGCRGAERERRGFEARPDLFEEFRRRYESLLDRAGEIMERTEA